MIWAIAVIYLNLSGLYVYVRTIKDGELTLMSIIHALLTTWIAALSDAIQLIGVAYTSILMKPFLWMNCDKVILWRREE